MVDAHHRADPGPDAARVPAHAQCAAGPGLAEQGWTDSAAMAAAESLDLRMRAGTAEATMLPPEPHTAHARTGDPYADAMALAAAQGGPSGAALLQREGVR